jgi:short-subunit dehydrogenase
MCQALKFDLDRAGVAISAILPGFVKTPLTNKNKFPMPFLMEVSDASRAMIAGLDAGRFLVAFPGGLAWPLRFMRILPAPIYFWLMKKQTGM